MTGEQIRQKFLSFFESKGHSRVPSSSLIPAADPTLLLTNAGMVQFKPYFIGEMRPPNPRLVSVQKCFRATDIDSVGDATHLTFFEMLGNFSIGDYFKKEAIEFAWEFLTEHLGLDGNYLWATVFTDDEEAIRYWLETGIPFDRIKRFGENDNYWGPAGNEGPCGPCSELHYDFGEKVGCLEVDCSPNCEHIIQETGQKCLRFVELWNLVFMEYYQDQDGFRTKLPSPNIDTGMGLERAAVILQGSDNIYQTDLFEPLVQRVAELSGKRYGTDYRTDQAIRVVAEHCRSAVFLISDGVVPGNDGRSYVLRRLIRRAIRYANRLELGYLSSQGLTSKEVNDTLPSFMADLGYSVIQINKFAYPDLLQREEFVLRVLRVEEERFGQVFAQGNGILRDLIEFRSKVMDSVDFHHGNVDREIPQVNTPGGVIAREALQLMLSESTDFAKTLNKWLHQVSGSEAFVMYDTYGFPSELTDEIARENGLSGIDHEHFIEHMTLQRNRARAASTRFKGGFEDTRPYQQLEESKTSFLGYEELSCESKIATLMVDNLEVTSVNQGDKVEVVIKETPFFPEMGGQIGDTGRIYADYGSLYVEDTQSPISGLVVHKCIVISGTLNIGDVVRAEVDYEKRQDTARNHSATHMLHAALREVLGLHVRQQGSLVSQDRLRFDFTHVSPLTDDELLRVQSVTNQKIRENIEVLSTDTTYHNAVDRGALAFFGDRYGDKVRLVEMRDSTESIFSLEVCGGTHVGHTGEIGYCHIISETGIGSGIRRIEAVTGKAAEEVIVGQRSVIQDVSKKLQVAPEKIIGKLEDLIDNLQKTSRDFEKLEREVLKQEVATLPREQIQDMILICGRLNASSSELLRESGDWLKNEISNGVIVIGAVLDGRPNMIIMATDSLVEIGFHSGDLVKEVSHIIGGGGGGRQGMAQAGGRFPEKLDRVLWEAKERIKTWMNNP